jgi:hypothetical protein
MTAAPEARRSPGPPAPVAVRVKADDPAVAEALRRAVGASGRVERATHGFHTYPAGMHPDCAREVMALAPEGGVHDPFCGGGTVLVEARLAGRPTSGTDLSPIALLVSRARCSGPELAGPLRAASRRIAGAAQTPLPTVVPEVCAPWYEPHVADELGRLRDGILEVAEEPVRQLLFAVLSSIVIKASHRESDTTNRRAPGHRPPGTTAVLFHKKARELGRMLDGVPAELPAPRLKLGDARRVGPPEGTGLVLTSPPYPGVYDYVPMQQLRLAWLGLGEQAELGLRAEVGSRRSFRAHGRAQALSRWREDTTAWVGAMVQGLRPGGRVAIVVGDGLVGDRPVDTLSPTVEALLVAGARVLGRASADRPDHAREVLRTEHLVLAQV